MAAINPCGVARLTFDAQRYRPAAAAASKMFSGSGAPLPIARTAYSCHVAGRNCIGPTARSKLAFSSSTPWSVSDTAGYPWFPSSNGPRIRGFATPDQLGFDDPPPRAWSDSMRPMPARTAQLSLQLGAALASACAALIYAARASRGMVPEPDHAGRVAGSRVGGACEGRPTDAGCRTTAGTSQLAGSTTAVGVGAASADDATDCVIPMSTASVTAAFATGSAAAFATTGSRGKPPDAWESTNAAAKNATAAAALQPCARDVVRRVRECCAAAAWTRCFELLACLTARTCRGSARTRTGSGAPRI